MSDNQQRLLRSILTGVPGVLALKNGELAYEVVNPAFCQFLGRGPEEIVGKKDADLFAAEEAKQSAQGDQFVLDSGVPRTQRQTLTGHGGARWFEVTRGPVFDDSGEAAGIIFTARDISEYVRREEELRAGEAEREALEQRAAQALAQAKEALEHLKKSHARVGELEKQVQSLTAERDAAAEQEAQAQQQQQALVDQLAQAKEALETSAARATELEEQLAAARAVQEQAGKLEEQHAADQSRIEELQQQAQEAAQTAAQLEQRCAELEAEKQRLGALRAEAGRLAQDLAAKLGRAD